MLELLRVLLLVAGRHVKFGMDAARRSLFFSLSQTTDVGRHVILYPILSELLTIIPELPRKDDSKRAHSPFRIPPRSGYI